MAEKSPKKNRKAEFYRIYNEKIKPSLKDIEKERSSLLRVDYLKIIFFIVFTSFLLYIFSKMTLAFSHMQSLLGLSYLYFVFIFIAAIFYLKSILFNDADGIHSLKTRRLQTLLNVFGDIKWMGNSNFYKSSIISDEEIERSGLFINYNKRTIDDEFQGNYKNISFKISETKMQEEHKYDRLFYLNLTSFQGVILSYKFNKKIRNRTIVSTKGNRTSKNQAIIYTLISLGLITVVCLQILRIWLLHIFSIFLNDTIIILIDCIIAIPLFIFFQKRIARREEKLDKVLLEDPKFSKRFNIYSSNQVEARYLVTTAFMERFYNLQTAFGAKNIKCSFYNDTLMIAIETNNDLFEIGHIYCSLNRSIYKLYKEINSIYKIIDCLKLYEHIGL